MTIDWGAPAAWDKRSDEFGALSKFDDGRLIVAMEYSPKLGRWDALREAWMELSPHPHLLDPLEAYGDDGLLLRYAAFNWNHPPLMGLANKLARRTMSEWIQQLADVFRRIAAEVEPGDFHLFARPLVKIDLGEAVRVGFWPVPEGHVAAPELDRKRPKWDERSLVFVVGQTLQTMVDYERAAESGLGQVIGNCVEPNPRHRYQTLAALQEAADAAAPSLGVRDAREALAWSYIEEGIGWLAVGDRLRAFEAFSEVRSSPYDAIADWGRSSSTAARHVREPAMGVRAWPPRPAAPTLEPYDRGRFIERASQSAHAGDAGHAFELAHQVLRRDPYDVDALAVIADVALQIGQHAHALDYIERLVGKSADVGRHHYRRGKALFGLGRLADARDAFEHALDLDPKLVEAVLLRREVDRLMKQTRLEVGTQHAPVIELPESLAPLRDVIAAGKPRAIIEALSAPEHADNPDAQLLLARYLALDGDPDRAQAIYDRVTLAPPPHRQRALVGKAGLMLAAGALVSALALFDVVCAEAPSDLDASEGRAQTLERLGRLGEAAAEYRRFVGLANARADLRVRAAQQWLDDHVL